MMLEDIAIQYVSQDEAVLKLITYCIAIVGALIAGFFHKSNFHIHRAPYFAYSGLIFLLAASSQIVWLGSFAAMTGGYLWLFMGVDTVVQLAVGYALCVLAMARSRDAYGHAKMAYLGFIPLANLWLILTPSKGLDINNQIKVSPLFKGILGIILGFIFYALGGAIGKFIENETERSIVDNQDNPKLQRAGVDLMMRANGIENTIKQMASEVKSQRLDEITTLLKVEGEGKILRYFYEISTNPDSLPRSFVDGLLKHNCNYEPLRPIIEEGGRIEHVYQREDNSQIGVVQIDKRICMTREL